MATDHQALRQVTEPQQVAIEALIVGASYAEAAAAAGVTHQKLSVWRTHHPGFQAELNQRHVEHAEQRTAQLRSLDALALEAVANQLASGDPNFAMDWLALRGRDATQLAEPGPTDPDQIVERRVADSFDHAQRDRSEEMDYALAGLNREQLRTDIEAQLAALIFD